MKKMPAFTYKLNPGQIGNGIYAMVACFPTLEVHVPFTFTAHSENEYLQDVGEAIPCDGSCKHYTGTMEDFCEERHHTSYSVRGIVKKATAYADKQGD